MTTPDLTDLDRMYAEATPGEWIDSYGAVLVDEPNKEWICEPGRMSDASFIVALHNAYPALAQRIRELEARCAELEKLEQALKTKEGRESFCRFMDKAGELWDRELGP